MDKGFLEEFKTFLPAYLSSGLKERLFEELDSFPDNYNYYMFDKGRYDLLQGDLWDGLAICNISRNETKEVSGIILSNSCDIDVANESAYRRKVVFCPIISLEGYKQLLLSNKDTTAVENIINDIKKQRITYLFYLPVGGDLKEECVALLDDTHSVHLDEFLANRKNKFFALSQYGFYLLLIKLSIHFTRFHEGVLRFDESSA